MSNNTNPTNDVSKRVRRSKRIEVKTPSSVKRVSSSKLEVIKEKKLHHWTYRDKKAFVEAVKKHGLSDVNKIAQLVGTKVDYEIEAFVNKVTSDVQKKQDSSVILRRLFFSCIEEKDLFERKYPPIALWKRIILTFLKKSILKQSDSYSIIISELFDKMAKEEEELFPVENPNLPNFKECYAYIRDLLSNTTPALLSPMGSYSTLIALEEVMSLIRNREDLQEEDKFLKDYLGPARFVGITGKEDFKRVLNNYRNYHNFVPFFVSPEDACQEENEQEILSGSSPKGQEESSCSSQMIVDQDDESQLEDEGNEMDTKLDDQDAVEKDTKDQDIEEKVTADSENGNESINEEEPDEEFMFKISSSLFKDVARHIKVKECMNPLMAHVFILHNGQKVVEEHFEKIENPE